MYKIKKSKMRSCLIFLLVLLLPLSFASADESIDPGWEGPEINSHAGILMEFSTGNIILNQNGVEKLHPASLTKIMTIMLTYEAVEEGRASWDDTVVVSENAWRQSGSQMFLNVGQEVSLKELVKGVIIVSANDACVAIAEHLRGSEKLFVQEMNDKADELGLENTRFQNTHGLPEEEHYSSAEDTAELARTLVKRYPEALELYTTEEFKFNDIKQENRNPLLGRFEGADGIKTGYTHDAGYNLVGTAERDGMRFISVVMKSESNAERLDDSQLLLGHGFQNYTLYSLFSKDELINTAEVSGGVEQEVDLLSKRDIEKVVHVDRKDEIESRVEIPEEITAPVEKGEPVGTLQVLLDNELLSETELLTADSIERAGITTRIFQHLTNFFSGLWEQATDALSDLIHSYLYSN